MKQTEDNASNEAEDDCVNDHGVTNYEAFNNIDTYIECHSALEPDFVDEIVELVLNERCSAEKVCSEPSGSVKRISTVAKEETVSCLKKARFYFMQEGVSTGTCIEYLNRCLEHMNTSGTKDF